MEAKANADTRKMGSFFRARMVRYHSLLGVSTHGNADQAAISNTACLLACIYQSI